MSKIVKLKLDGSYLLLKPADQLKVLSGQAGEVYFGGQSDKLCAMLVEAMRTHEFMWAVVHYANEEYELRYGKQREALDAVPVNQLVLSF